MTDAATPPPPSPQQVLDEAITCAYETAARLLHREPSADSYVPGALLLTIRRGDAAGLVAQAIAKIQAADRELAGGIMLDTLDAARLQVATTALHTAVAAFRAADSSH